MITGDKKFRGKRDHQILNENSEKMKRIDYKNILTVFMSKAISKATCVLLMLSIIKAKKKLLSDY